MKINHKQFAVATVLLLVLDYLWLSFFMGKQYRPLILKIQKSPMEINYISAIISYSFMILGLYQFIYKYNFSLVDTYLFGACLYAVYNFTCGAIIKEWDFKISFIDIAWCGFVYTASLYIAQKLIK